MVRITISSNSPSWNFFMRAIFLNVGKELLQRGVDQGRDDHWGLQALKLLDHNLSFPNTQTHQLFFQPFNHWIRSADIKILRKIFHLLFYVTCIDPPVVETRS